MKGTPRHCLLHHSAFLVHHYFSLLTPDDVLFCAARACRTGQVSGCDTDAFAGSVVLTKAGSTTCRLLLVGM